MVIGRASRSETTRAIVFTHTTIYCFNHHRTATKFLLVSFIPANIKVYSNFHKVHFKTGKLLDRVRNMVLMLRKTLTKSEESRRDNRETILDGSSREDLCDFQTLQPLNNNSRHISSTSHSRSSGGASSFKIWFRTLSFVCLISYGLCIFYTDSKENDFPRLGRRSQSFDAENDGLLDVDVDEDGFISQKEYHIATRPRHALDRWISKWNFKMSDTNSKYLNYSRQMQYLNNNS